MDKDKEGYQPESRITAEEHKAATGNEDSLGGVGQPKGRTTYDIPEKLDLLNKKALTPEIALEIVKTVRLVPYLHKDMMNALQTAATAFCSAVAAYPSAVEAYTDALEPHNAPVLEENEQAVEPLNTPQGYQDTSIASSTERRLLAMLAEKDAMLANERAMNAKKDAMIAKERAFVLQHANCRAGITKIVKSLQHDDTALDECAVMTQAEKSASRNSESLKAADRHLQKYEGSDPDVAGQRLLSKALYTGKGDLDLQYYMIPNTSKEGHVLDMLKQAAEAWAARVIKDENIPEELQGTDGRITNIDERIPPMSTTTAKFMAHEVTHVQPYFMILLLLISNCCKMSPAPQDFTPSKTQVKQNQIIAGTKNRQRRLADLSISKPGCFHLSMLDMLLQLTFELKPLSRQKISLKGLHDQSVEQTMSHLSKFVRQGLHLFDIGASTWATGVTGTVVYISILKLELFMMAYSEFNQNQNVSQLKLTESDKLPLMTQTNFKAFAKLCPQNMADQVEELRQELYGNDPKNEGVDENGVPMGIRLIYDLMMSPRSKLFGPDYKKIFGSVENTIDDLLGSGSFGLVFSLKEDTNAVLKVSLTPNPVHLDNEETILRHLGRQESPDTIINDEFALPVLMQVKNDFAFELGGCRHEMKALILRPKGQSIQSLARVEDIECRFGNICSQLKLALDFIHEKNVLHNDVTPKNVVVCVNGEDWKAYLVDFGCASKSTETIHGFVGTSDYAHPKVLKKYPAGVWKACPDYDFFGLGLTMSALLNKGDACWDMKPFPTTLTTDNRDDFDSVVSNRLIKARAKIYESNCSAEDKAAWMNLITRKVSREHLRRAAAALFQKPREAELSPIPPISKNLHRAATKRKGMTIIDSKSSGTSPKKKRPRTDFKSPCSSLMDSATELEQESIETKQNRPNETRRRPNRSMKAKGMKIKK